MMNDDQHTIEFWENEYLKQIEHCLRIDYDKMMYGFATKEYIKDDWKPFLGKETSDFARGAERIFYWLFNQFGQPNSSPIGSDLFFETYNAYVHIDIKTVTLANIGDYTRNIFVGNNQVSYGALIEKQNGNNEMYIPNLPTIYTKKEENNNITSKICLTYFITILYDEVNLDIYNLSVICVPNGNLYSIYGNDVYSAGKNPGKARFSFSKCSEFKMLPSNPKRIKIIKHLDVLQSNYTKMTQETYSRKMEWWNRFHNESKHGKNL